MRTSISTLMEVNADTVSYHQTAKLEAEWRINIMAHILTVTLNPTVDVASEADAVRPTRKTRLSSTRYDPGGGGINVARVVKVMGGDVEAIFLAGGEIGRLLDRLLEEEELPRRSFPTSGQTRIAFMVHEHTTGLEYRFIPQGSPVSPEELKPCFDAIASQQRGYIVASGSLPTGAPDDSFARMAEIAHARGLKFVLDTSGPALGLALRQSKVFLVKPSRGELEQLVGRKLDQRGIEQAAADIVARGAAKFVACTLGADGALLASSDGVLRLPAIHVRVRSAVGAGDSFLGAMVWALSEGHSPEEAFRLGMAAGAAAAMTPGTELCSKTDVFELLERNRAQKSGLH
jgi:6-phosphofructokinase 2